MSDAVSRQYILDAFAEYIEEYKEVDEKGNHDPKWCAMQEAEMVVKEAPSAQPETIYCRDCKYWIPYDWMFSEVWQSKNIADYPEDEIGCNLCDISMNANDFCSRGERRQDG